MLAAALALALAMVWFNDRILPESNHRARMLLTDITRKKPTWSLEENIFLDHFEGYSIKVRTIARQTSEIQDIIVIQTANAERVITAKRGQMYFSSDGSMLMLELEDGEVLEVDAKNPNGYTMTEFGKQKIAIPGASSDFERTTQSSRGDREMTVSMMVAQNRDREKKLLETRTQADSLIAGTLAVLFDTADSNAQTMEHSEAVKMALESNKELRGKLLFLEKNAANFRKEINSMDVEIQKKFSIPMACLAFVLIGAPLGSLARKGGFATGIGLSLFFFIIYWAFLIGGEQMADAGLLSAFWAMWLPNFILSAVGILLSVMFVRQSTVVSIIDRLRPLFHIGRAKVSTVSNPARLDD
jgi:lipopolysaccharide export system permease protein